MIIRLVFMSAHWHGLAKLRLHTDLTLGIMDRLTTELGKALRDFEEHTCPAYVTRELPRETAARERRQKSKKTTSNNSEGVEPSAGILNPESEDLKRLKKTLNLGTYKYHSLGDYVDTIRRYGTTDSYSSQTVYYTHLLTCFILTYYYPHRAS